MTNDESMTKSEIEAMCSGFSTCGTEMAEKVLTHQRRYKTFKRARQYLQYALSLTDTELRVELPRPISRWNREKTAEVAAMYEQRDKAFQFKGKVIHMLKIGFSADDLNGYIDETVEYLGVESD